MLLYRLKERKIMRIKDYPYGKTTKSLAKAVNYLNLNKIKIYKSLLNSELLDDSEYIKFAFDYPDYLYMPKQISSRLNSDEVDWLQAEWYNFCETYELKLKKVKK